MQGGGERLNVSFSHRRDEKKREREERKEKRGLSKRRT
jgi:hypothetical protein